MNEFNNQPTPKDSKLVPVAVALLAGVIVAGGIWTYTTRDWNASGTQKAGSAYSSAPSEGGKPLALTK